MKLILILVFLLLIACGGGGAYYYFFILSAQTHENAESAPPPTMPDIRFVEMDALRIPVLRGGAVVNYVVLNITLETIGPENEQLARALIPRLTNAYLTDLNGYFASVPVEDRILVKAIKRRLQIIANRVLGPGTVNDILIQNAFKQKG